MTQLKMPIVRIRFALHGCKNRPFYHIVVASNRSKRDGKHLEQVGCYDPMPNYNNELVVGLNVERIRYWLSVGAQPTVAVNKLLGLAGLTPKHPRLYLEASRHRKTGVINDTITADLEEDMNLEQEEEKGEMSADPSLDTGGTSVDPPPDTGGMSVDPPPDVGGTSVDPPLEAGGTSVDTLKGGTSTSVDADIAEKGTQTIDADTAEKGSNDDSTS